MKIPRLMLITDGSIEANPLAIDKIRSACENGLPALQLREKQTESRKLWELAGMLREITAKHGVFFTINERIDIALAVEADGVHLPEKSLSAQVAKRLKPSLIVGISVHSEEAALRAEQEGADYLLFGPVFQTPSKMPYGNPQGLDHLKKITSRISIPVIAVGGIAPLHVRGCMEAGAHGVAAIGAFMQACDLKETINEFLEQMACQ